MGDRCRGLQSGALAHLTRQSEQPREVEANLVLDTGMISPAISVVIATYNRSRVLAYAIESVLRQTFTDWELIVVGDACTDDTAEVVARYAAADPRVRFVNLERNWGQQSAPNNIGRSLARAPLIAYLSHDDFWLPHHLKACREALAATGADLVLGTAANISFEGGKIAFDSLHVLLQGMGEDHRWSPSNLHASFVAASCWLIRTEALDKIGGWRMSQEEHAEPSQGLLFRLWQRGFRIYLLNQLTLVILSAGHRPTSYLQRETPEHDWIAKHLTDSAFASELAARMPSSNAFADSRSPHRPPFWRRAPAQILATYRDQSTRPNDCDAPRLEPGRVCSLFAGAPESRPDRPLAAGPLPFALTQCDAPAESRLERRWIFTPERVEHATSASGWSTPEVDGVWSDGPVGIAHVRRRQPPDRQSPFCIFPRSFSTTPPGVPREVAIDTARGQPIHRWSLTSKWRLEGRRPGLRLDRDLASVCVFVLTANGRLANLASR